jgi:hypothetical protein
MAGFGLLRKRGGVVVAAWALVAAILLVQALLQFSSKPLLTDANDAMRMVSATDLLNGQGWQDVVQHRDNAPQGTDTPSSRLIDAPLALLMAISRPVAGVLAPDVAAIVWPLILLLPLLAFSALIVRRLVPDSDRITGPALPLISLALLIAFLPGRVDDDNVQVLLMLAAMLALVAWRDRLWGGVVAGLAFATSIAIGLDTLPFLALGMIVVAVVWALDPERYWPTTVAFGISLAFGTLAHFLMAVAPERYAIPACGTISIAYVVTLGLGGLTIAVVAALATPLRLTEARLTVIIVAAGAVALISALMFPMCLGGPYSAIDPRAFAALVADNADLQSLWQRLIDDPATGIAYSFAALAAVVIMIVRVRGTRGAASADWLIALSFLTVSVALMIVQTGWALFAAAFAIPAGAWLIAEARRFYVDKGTARGALGLVGSWLLFAGVLQFAVVAVLGPRPAGGATSPFGDVSCFRAADYAELATFPPRNVVAPARVGSHVLRYTPHSVVSAGTLGNSAGTLDVVDFFEADEATARAIAEERSIDIIADCSNANALNLTEYEWLRALPNGGTLSLYSVNLED